LSIFKIIIFKIKCHESKSFFSDDGVDIPNNLFILSGVHNKKGQLCDESKDN